MLCISSGLTFIFMANQNGSLALVPTYKIWWRIHNVDSENPVESPAPSIASTMTSPNS